MHYPHAVHRSNYFTTWREKDWKVIYHTLPEIPTTGGRINSEMVITSSIIWVRILMNPTI